MSPANPLFGSEVLGTIGALLPRPLRAAAAAILLSAAAALFSLSVASALFRSS